jgi:hypothetical protein
VGQLLLLAALLSVPLPLVAKSLDELRADAEQGAAAAQFELGKDYALGEGVAKNLTETIKWFRKAAEQGCVPAQFNLGVMYATGIGVPIDTTEAANWYRKAADQGDVRSQFNLGVAYAAGNGVAKNPTEAIRWFRKAADKGNTAARLNLLVMNATGGGMTSDPTEVENWFHKAAGQGIAPAQFFLGLMYATGERGLKDLIEALAWIASLWVAGNYCYVRFMTKGTRCSAVAPRWMNMVRIWKIGRKMLPWLLLLALISRRPDRLVTSQFWGEDGTIFFSQAYKAGCEVWFHSYSGYFHIAPRLIAWAWAKLPWVWTPLAYNLSALAVWAYIIRRIGTARLPAGFRWMAAAALVFTVHSGEVFLNITDLQWSLVLILAVNLLEPHPNGPWETIRRCAEVLIAGLSSPLVLVALAGVAIRAFSWRRQKGRILLAAYITAATLQGFAFSNGDRGINIDLPHLAVELVEVFPLYLAYPAGAGFFNGCSGRGLLLIGLVLSVVTALLIRHGLRGEDRWRVLAIFLGVAACLAAGRMPHRIWVGPFDPGNARYTYVPLVLMTWLLAWIASQGKTRAVRRVGLVLVCVAFLSSMVHWRGIRETDYHWTSQVSEAESGKRQFFVVPPGWQFPVPRFAEK